MDTDPLASTKFLTSTGKVDDLVVVGRLVPKLLFEPRSITKVWRNRLE